jgi:phosphoadenosine phosphosulfate reductase
MPDTLLSDDDLRTLNDRFEAAHPREIVRWALASRASAESLASAFQAETCVMHMATQIRRRAGAFLDTGFHFDETLAFKRRLTELLGLTVVELAGDHTPRSQADAFGPRLYERDPERCCDINKVRPMLGALRGRDAWVTAFRRDSSPTRATAPIVDRYELEPGSWIVKVNPLPPGRARHKYLRSICPTMPCTTSGTRHRMRAMHPAAVPRRART